MTLPTPKNEVERLRALQNLDTLPEQAYDVLADKLLYCAKENGRNRVSYLQDNTHPHP